jgi:hypothetical protein
LAGHVIHPTQTTFMLERNILNRLVILHELFTNYTSLTTKSNVLFFSRFLEWKVFLKIAAF